MAGAGHGDEGGGHVAGFHAFERHGVQVGGVHVLVIVPAEAVEGHQEQLVLGALLADGHPRRWNQEGGQSREEDG